MTLHALSLLSGRAGKEEGGRRRFPAQEEGKGVSMGYGGILTGGGRKGEKGKGKGIRVCRYWL